MQNQNQSRANTKKIQRGRLIEGLVLVPGWNDVYLPLLKKHLEMADKKVHDFRSTEETVKEKNGYYRGILKALTLIDDIAKLKRIGEKYCEDHGLSID